MNMGVAIVEKYDKKCLFSMFSKSYNHSHPFFEVESFVVYIIDEDMSLDTLEMVVGTTNLQSYLLIENYDIS
jgi:hypothetical protein